MVKLCRWDRIKLILLASSNHLCIVHFYYPKFADIWHWMQLARSLLTLQGFFFLMNTFCLCMHIINPLFWNKGIEEVKEWSCNLMHCQTFKSFPELLDWSFMCWTKTIKCHLHTESVWNHQMKQLNHSCQFSLHMHSRSKDLICLNRKAKKVLRFCYDGTGSWWESCHPLSAVFGPKPGLDQTGMDTHF